VNVLFVEAGGQLYAASPKGRQEPGEPSKWDISPPNEDLLGCIETVATDVLLMIRACDFPQEAVLVRRTAKLLGCECQTDNEVYTSEGDNLVF